MSDDRLLELERACRESDGVEDKTRLIIERQRLSLLGQEWVESLKDAACRELVQWVLGYRDAVVERLEAGGP